MNKIKYISATILILIGILTGIGSIEQFQIKNLGQKSKMEILNIPSICSGTKSKHYMKVQYGLRVFIKQVPSKYCEKYSIGDQIEMIHAKGHDIILFPKENIYYQAIFPIILLIVGIVISLKKVKKANNKG